MAKHRYARYPDISGEHNLSGLCEIARKHGMRIIMAYKPNMHVCNEIGLYGTSLAMKNVDKEWIKAGHTIHTAREKNLVFGVNLKMPMGKWLDKDPI